MAAGGLDLMELDDFLRDVIEYLEAERPETDNRTYFRDVLVKRAYACQRSRAEFQVTLTRDQRARADSTPNNNYGHGPSTSHTDLQAPVEDFGKEVKAGKLQRYYKDDVLNLRSLLSQTRWVVLYSHGIVYAKDEQALRNRKYKRVALLQYKVQTAFADNCTIHLFHPDSTKKEFCWRASSVQERKEWQDAISSVLQALKEADDGYTSTTQYSVESTSTTGTGSLSAAASSEPTVASSVNTLESSEEDDPRKTVVGSSAAAACQEGGATPGESPHTEEDAFEAFGEDYEDPYKYRGDEDARESVELDNYEDIDCPAQSSLPDSVRTVHNGPTRRSATSDEQFEDVLPAVDDVAPPPPVPSKSQPQPPPPPALPPKKKDTEDTLPTVVVPCVSSSEQQDMTAAVPPPSQKPSLRGLKLFGEGGVTDARSRLKPSVPEASEATSSHSSTEISSESSRGTSSRSSGNTSSQRESNRSTQSEASAASPVSPTDCAPRDDRFAHRPTVSFDPTQTIPREPAPRLPATITHTPTPPATQPVSVVAALEQDDSYIQPLSPSIAAHPSLASATSDYLAIDDVDVDADADYENPDNCDDLDRPPTLPPRTPRVDEVEQEEPVLPAPRKFSDPPHSMAPRPPGPRADDIASNELFAAPSSVPRQTIIEGNIYDKGSPGDDDPIASLDEVNPETEWDAADTGHVAAASAEPETPPPPPPPKPSSSGGGILSSRLRMFEQQQPSTADLPRTGSKASPSVPPRHPAPTPPSAAAKPKVIASHAASCAAASSPAAPPTPVNRSGSPFRAGRSASPKPTPSPKPAPAREVTAAAEPTNSNVEGGPTISSVRMAALMFNSPQSNVDKRASRSASDLTEVQNRKPTNRGSIERKDESNTHPVRSELNNNTSSGPPPPPSRNNNSPKSPPIKEAEATTTASASSPRQKPPPPRRQDSLVNSPGATRPTAATPASSSRTPAEETNGASQLSQFEKSRRAMLQNLSMKQ